MIDLIDRAVRSRALVLGTPPPAGRDLDLLVRQGDFDAVIAALADAGFSQLDGRWVRFLDCTVEVVDVETAESWELPFVEVNALFDDAVALEGTARLARPGPAGVVLIEARRFARGGVLTPKRLARVAQALSTDGVRDQVEARLDAWGARGALPAVAGEVRASADSVRKLQRRAARGLGVVVSLSGVDGSGKSSQSAALQGTLERLGYDAVSVWTRITINPSVNAVGDPLKKLVKRVRGRNPGGSSGSGGSDGGSGVDPVRAFRQSNPLVNHAWITYVAVVNALAVRRATTAHLLRGRVVICDRYDLDSAAHLRYKYGEDGSTFRFQARVIRLLTPRPLRSYFLDVRANTALSRKNEKYTPEQMERLAGLYREEQRWLGVHHLDGERPKEDLCAEIAGEVAAALIQRRARRMTLRSAR